MKRICLFGGSFDPVHKGHIHLATAALEQGGQDEVVVLPAANPPHKQGLLQASATERLEMARLAFADLDGVRVSDFEIQRGGVSYTIETVTGWLAGNDGEPELAWLIGADSLPQLPKWREARRLLSLCRILTVPRPDFPTQLTPALIAFFGDEMATKLAEGFINVEPVPDSSSDIRRMLTEGGDPSNLLPRAVGKFIRTRNIYQQELP